MGFSTSTEEKTCPKCKAMWKITVQQYPISDQHNDPAICSCGHVFYSKDRMRDYSMHLLSSPPAKLEGGATED